MMYNFCPIGGVVCSSCNYPLQKYDGYIKEIAKHERNNNNHAVVQSYEERLTLTSAFQKYNDDLAERIITALPNQILARDIILAEINPLSIYKYCTECSIIVYDVSKHKSNKHVRSCTDNCNGYASKYWTKKNPRILPCTFTMNDIGLLSTSLQESIQKEMRKQNKLNVLNGLVAEEKLTIYKQLNTEQENRFAQNDENIIIRHIEVNKNADLWLSRTGWATYLEGFTAPAIHEVTRPFNVVDEQMYVQLETNLVLAVKDRIEYVRRIDSIHHIFYTVQRRPNRPYPSKPFQVPSDSSYERYLSSIRMIF